MQSVAIHGFIEHNRNTGAYMLTDSGRAAFVAILERAGFNFTGDGEEGPPRGPATILFKKVTIKGAKQAVQMFGPAQHAVAKAVADSVAEGVIPADEAENLFICAGVFIHWEAADDKKIQDYNYRATKEAIARAVKGEPKVSEVVGQRDKVKHPFAAA
jgi:formaldehyde-activating enzyme involved in methanogenesis